MSENLDSLQAVTNTLIARATPITSQRIHEIVEQCRVMFPDVTDAEAQRLEREFETQHDVTMEHAEILTEKQYEPWLDKRKAKVDPYYWERYSQLLEEKRFSAQVINTLDRETDRVLDFLGDPFQTQSWDRRGLIFGHVQSGKTAHYIGLICKAADAGYRFIVVIAGIHNNLRQQTQSRIDEGFIGIDSARSLSLGERNYIGVGKFKKVRTPGYLTSSLKDFNKNAAHSMIGMSLGNSREPIVCVVKKNANTLRNLTEWLRATSATGQQYFVNEPMLLIDDEADNASINIQYGKEGISTINGQIRKLLKLFSRSCYVGITATPFANIFIEPDTENEMYESDLFPRHFIVSLEPPSNYFGTNKVFLQDSSPAVEYINDNEEVLPIRHDIDWNLEKLPLSMIKAIRTFVLACTIRLTMESDRRQHCSMLVNASRFINVQSQLKYEIEIVLKRIQQSVRVYGALSPDQALKDPEMAAMERTWQEVYASTIPVPAWATIQNCLHQAASPIKVIEVNSRSTEPLNYSHYRNGLSVIAVGGYSLSRGMTLEGLTVRYFLRSSIMYDTLMQMGRWFGYRNGYENLCRLWMTEETEGWYQHISESIEELRAELHSMVRLGATPQEFGLRVRSHPDNLIVTARNKMGSGQMLRWKIGLANRFCETSILKRDQASLKANLQSVFRLGEYLEKIGYPPSSAEKDRYGWLLQNIPSEAVLKFLGEFQNHPGCNLTDPRPLTQYIIERSETELQAWDVLFASVQDSRRSRGNNILGIKINYQTRTAGSRSDNKTLYVSNKQRVSSRGIEKVGLSSALIERVESEYDQAVNRRKANYPDRIYRAERTHPLLIIHLLKIEDPQNEIEHHDPVVAWSISFPKTKTEEERVEYVVNTTWTWWQGQFGADIEEEEMKGDDV